MNNLDDELTAFRTTWLRAIAFAWSNKEFKHELLHPPKGEDALDVITKRFPQASNVGEAITLSVQDAPEFVWIGNDWSWVAGPKGEGLTLYIPLTPPVDDVAQCAAALTDYYATRPQLFAHVGRQQSQPAATAAATPEARPHSPVAAGGDHSQSAVPRRMEHFAPIMALANSLVSVFKSQRVFSDLGPQNGHLQYGAGTFREFEIALTVVMARAWKNSEFRALIQKPGNFTKALQYAHGYAPPWQLHTRIKDDTRAKWSPRSGWANLSRHELQLSLPQQPGGDRNHQDDWSVALAAYNATGAQYPFSCCGAGESVGPQPMDCECDADRR